MTSSIKGTATREKSIQENNNPFFYTEVSDHGFEVNLMSLKFSDRTKAATVTEQKRFIISPDFIPKRISAQYR